MLVGCSNERSIMRSSGGFYEIFVICSDESWKGELGDTLRSVLLEPVPMLNQREPRFDVVHVPGSAYKGIILQHRNLLNITVSKEYAEPELLAVYDKYAEPQIVLSLNAPSYSSAISYISKHRAELRAIIEKAESDRAVAFNKKYNELAIEKLVEEKFGFSMSIPRGYTLRNQTDHFAWISNELSLASQGIVIYSYPYAGKKDFLVENLIKRRNEFVSKIPGELEGTYMKSSNVVDPAIKYVKIAGRHWAQMNGFWDVYNDFMGGPFVSFSTIDARNQRVVCIDMYVYSPKHHKRNYLRALENLIYSVSFPGDEKTK